MEINHIFFHNDLDGIVCAAIFLYKNLKSKYRLYSVSSSMRGEKFNELFLSVPKSDKDKKIILDYQYHKEADLWIDHHFNPEFGECQVVNDKIIYDPKRDSATDLVFEFIAPGSFGSQFVNHDLNMINIIDSCKYNSIKQIFQDKSQPMILRAFLEKAFPAEMTYCRIVEVLANSGLDFCDALYKLKIDSSHVRELEKNAIQIKNSIIKNKNISIVNQRRKEQFPRYSEYLIDQNIKYAIRLTPVGNNNIYFQIGYNMWHSDPNKFNISKMLTSFVGKLIVNGGGHFNVGAGIVKEANIEKLIDEMSIILNEEESMEKYAVDSTDGVEKKAAELVKEGSAKNLNDARKMAAEQIKTPTEGIDGTERKVQ